MTHLRLLLTAVVTLASATLAIAQVPSELESSRFSGPDLTPCPACLCVAATGEVYVGVDLNGSLGKGPEKGRIVTSLGTFVCSYITLQCILCYVTLYSGGLQRGEAVATEASEAVAAATQTVPTCLHVHVYMCICIYL